MILLIIICNDFYVKIATQSNVNSDVNNESFDILIEL